MTTNVTTAATQGDSSSAQTIRSGRAELIQIILSTSVHCDDPCWINRPAVARLGGASGMQWAWFTEETLLHSTVLLGSAAVRRVGCVSFVSRLDEESSQPTCQILGVGSGLNMSDTTAIFCILLHVYLPRRGNYKIMRIICNLWRLLLAPTSCKRSLLLAG